MMRSRMNRLAALGVVAALAPLAHAGEPPRFEVTLIQGLSQPMGQTPGQPLALNNNGRVVGYAQSGPGDLTAINWRGGVSMNLGGVQAFDRTFATRVNILGRVVGGGYMLDGNGAIAESRALRWTGGQLADLGNLGGHHAVAMGIDDSGRVVGYATLPGDTQTRAFIHQNGAMAPLASLPGTVESYAYDISNTGFVVGTAVTTSTARPVLWQGSAVAPLLFPGWARAGSATAVNDAGQVAGSVELAHVQGAFAAAVWQGGGMVNLGYLSGGTPYAVASDINNAGQVVGTAGVQGGRTGFLYHQGRMYDLRSLVISGPGGVQITSATSINDSGQIAATALINGVQTPVLLTPVVPNIPAPGALSVLLTGGVLAARRRR